MEDINRQCGAAATHHGSSQHAVQHHHATAVKDAGPLVGTAPMVSAAAAVSSASADVVSDVSENSVCSDDFRQSDDISSSTSATNIQSSSLSHSLVPAADIDIPSSSLSTAVTATRADSAPLAVVTKVRHMPPVINNCIASHISSPVPLTSPMTRFIAAYQRHVTQSSAASVQQPQYSPLVIPIHPVSTPAMIGHEAYLAPIYSTNAAAAAAAAAAAGGTMMPTSAYSSYPVAAMSYTPYYAAREQYISPMYYSGCGDNCISGVPISHAMVSREASAADVSQDDSDAWLFSRYNFYQGMFED